MTGPSAEEQEAFDRLVHDTMLSPAGCAIRDRHVRHLALLNMTSEFAESDPVARQDQVRSLLESAAEAEDGGAAMAEAHIAAMDDDRRQRWTQQIAETLLERFKAAAYECFNAKVTNDLPGEPDSNTVALFAAFERGEDLQW